MRLRDDNVDILDASWAEGCSGVHQHEEGSPFSKIRRNIALSRGSITSVSVLIHAKPFTCSWVNFCYYCTTETEMQ